MKKLYIIVKKPSLIQAMSKTFSFYTSRTGYNKGTISLTSNGNYSLSMHSFGVSETTAKRTPEYKLAISQLSMDMFHAYETQIKQFTCMHHNMLQIPSSNSFDKELILMSPKTYIRQTINLKKPQRSEVEEDLRKEIKCLLHNPINDTNLNTESFIKENLNKLTEERQSHWQKAVNLFTQIEDAREKKENAKFYNEYRLEFNKKQAFIEGDNNIVEANLKEICANANLPFNVSLDYIYSMEDKTLSINIIIDDGLNIPILKASILASGKISVKEKSMKEIANEKTTCALSLLYYLGSLFFSASPNIDSIRISLWDKEMAIGYMWVEFNRSKFVNIIPTSINIASEFLSQLNYSDIKFNNGSMIISPIDKNIFKIKVQDLVKHLDDNRIVITRSKIKMKDK